MKRHTAKPFLKEAFLKEAFLKTAFLKLSSGASARQVAPANSARSASTVS